MMVALASSLASRLSSSLDLSRILFGRACNFLVMQSASSKGFRIPLGRLSGRAVISRGMFIPRPDRLYYSTHLHKHGNQLPRISICYGYNTLIAVVVEYSGGSALDERDACEGEQVGPRASTEAVGEVVQDCGHCSVKRQRETRNTSAYLRFAIDIVSRRRAYKLLNSPVTHLLAELDDPCSKTLTRLGQRLDGASWHLVLPRDSMEGHLMA